MANLRKFRYLSLSSFFPTELQIKYLDYAWKRMKFS